MHVEHNFYCACLVYAYAVLIFFKVKPLYLMTSETPEGRSATFRVQGLVVFFSFFNFFHFFIFATFFIFSMFFIFYIFHVLHFSSFLFLHFLFIFSSFFFSFSFFFSGCSKSDFFDLNCCTISFDISYKKSIF